MLKNANQKSMEQSSSFSSSILAKTVSICCWSSPSSLWTVYWGNPVLTPIYHVCSRTRLPVPLPYHCHISLFSPCGPPKCSHRCIEWGFSSSPWKLHISGFSTQVAPLPRHLPRFSHWRMRYSSFSTFPLGFFFIAGAKWPTPSSECSLSAV